VTWSASARCTTLLGATNVETVDRPPTAYLPDDELCGEPSGARTAMIVALLLTAIGTFVAFAWCLDPVPAQTFTADQS
jgi:hypothetical protein